MRRSWRAAAAVLTILALAGCTARTSVHVTVRSAQTAEVVLAVELTGEAAQVVSADAQALEELVGTVESRTGTSADVDTSEDRVRVSATTGYDELANSADVTGVAGLRLAPEGDRVRAELALSDAPELLAALAAATAGQPDADALAATLARSTLLEVTVRFPGGIAQGWQAVGLDDEAVTVDGDTLTVVRAADQAGQGTVVVTGDPSEQVNLTLVAIAGVVVLVAIAAAWARRKDAADPRLTARP